MLMKSVFAASALALALPLQTSAFLIPLEVSREAGIAQANQVLKHQIVDLDCPSCPLFDSDGQVEYHNEDDSPMSIHLELDITDDDQFLQINGQPVYPPPQTLIPIALHASEVQASSEFHTKPLRLGYALEVLPAVAEVTDIALIPIQFTILDLEGSPVHVDTVRIDLIQSWGHVHIARVTRLPYAQSPGAEQCTTSICRLRAIIAARIRQMVEAARTHADKAKTWIKNGCHGRKHAQAGTEQNNQNSHHNNHHHHGHHRFSRLRHFMRATLHLFVLPALFGIFGGLLACGLGMLVGRAFGLCLNRRSRDEGVRGLEAAITEDEKDALVENSEMPPQYEAVDIVVVEEEKK